MADFTNLKDNIKSNIKSNGKQEVTGAILQEQMIDIVDQMNETFTGELTELESELGNMVSTTSDTLNVKGVVLKSGSTLRCSVINDSFSSPVIGVYLLRADGTYQFVVTMRELNKEYTYTLEEDFDYIRFYNNNGVGEFTISYAVVPKGSQLGKIQTDITNLQNYVNGVPESISVIAINTIGKDFHVKGNQVLNIYDSRGFLKKDSKVAFSVLNDSFSSPVIGVYLLRADGTYQFVVTMRELNKEYTYTLEEDFDYIRFYNNNGVGEFSINLKIKEVLNSEKNENWFAFPYSAKIFRRVGCIGDSYTSGHIQLIGESVVANNPLYAWPHFMEGLTNNKWENWGSSGSTAKWWVSVETSRLYTQVKAEGNKCQAYVIGLMINDQGDWSSYATPVGNKSDIGTDADTYYAWYYKLIQEVILVNPDAKIFCNTCPKYAENYPYNIAVRDIVEYCRTNGQNVYLCDLASEKYNNDRFYKNPIFLSDAVNGHYTALGYEYMAECYLRVLSDVINENVTEFQNTFEIPYDE